jgi:hypothetical protein
MLCVLEFRIINLRKKEGVRKERIEMEIERRELNMFLKTKRRRKKGENKEGIV